MKPPPPPPPLTSSSKHSTERRQPPLSRCLRPGLAPPSALLLQRGLCVALEPPALILYLIKNYKIYLIRTTPPPMAGLLQRPRAALGRPRRGDQSRGGNNKAARPGRCCASGAKTCVFVLGTQRLSHCQWFQSHLWQQKKKKSPSGVLRIMNEFKPIIYGSEGIKETFFFSSFLS